MFSPKTISCVSKDFSGSPYLRAFCEDNETFATVHHAWQSFGFLVNRGERLDAYEFADRIGQHYDIQTPQIQAAITALHRLH